MTEAQKISLGLMHDTTRSGQIRDRIKAVLLTFEDWTAQVYSRNRGKPSPEKLFLPGKAPLKMAALKATYLLNKPLSSLCI
ncbi:hypothetical protein ID858_03370 [Xenorhabdus sp. DI]|uniref:hypothetical protein n=1 Tax=Xenorhabdus doucetiae TaxID=351671 RepID=UPI0019CBEB00|nr:MULTISPECIES: hypothetical protein [unclassified Xenorhabdus]MBD2785084.1 hypothetical protein [Xenorhabdus sp. 3]MBD2787547.1 hypothetical protein [Xenorhabdus sp. DI]